MIVAALAALRRGYAVVTLNPKDPATRHALVREAVVPSVLLSDTAHIAAAEEAGFDPASAVLIDGGAGPTEMPAAAAPDPDTIAFLIATSGSTGEPKLVLQPHRNILHNVLRYTNGLGIGVEDRIAWLASLSGGQGLATAWTALLNGATLCPFPIAERGVAGLPEWLAEHRVTVLDTVPSVLRNLALALRDRRIDGVRLVRLASEAGLGSDHAAYRRHFAGTCRLATVLGSSETGIMAQAILPAEFTAGERLPAGFEADGLSVTLEDADGSPVADGESGEIVVASRYLSPGYFEDEALTAARYATAGGVRRFHTGDLGIRRPDGMLAVVGRRDAQVKVRGHRLQLEEVESAIAAQPGVAAVAVAAGRTGRGETRLTAYVAVRPAAAVTGTGLRAALSERLPAFAVPAEFVTVDALPLTPHGKVDRARLGELTPVPAPAEPPPGPRAASETEELLAEIWREAFEHDDIRLDDPFLELGGDSLTAALIAARVREAFGVTLGLSTFASEITIASLAQLIGSGSLVESGDDGLPPLRPRRPPPASIVQRAMLRATGTDPGGLILANAYRITGPLDVDALRRGIERVIARHEVLRTAFGAVGDVPVQRVAAPAGIELPVYDLRGDPDPAARAAELLALEARRTFDLGRGPLLRFCLARTGADEHHLLRLNHHVIADAPSWLLFFEELGAAYEAELAGPPSRPAEPLPLQYSDYASWEQALVQQIDRPRLQAEIAWWREQLRDAPPPLRPSFERARPVASAAGASASIEWGLPPDRGEAIDRLARSAGATYYMSRLALCSALLALDGGVEDIVLEAFFSVRRQAELQRMIGPLINRALLRLRLTGAPTFRTWLTEVRRVVIDTSVHTVVPHMRLAYELHERGLEMPRVRAGFAALHQLPTMRFGGLQLDRLPREHLATRGFVLGVDRIYDATACRVEFNPHLYDSALVRRFIDRLQAFAAAVCARPDAPLREMFDGLPEH